MYSNNNPDSITNDIKNQDFDVRSRNIESQFALDNSQSLNEKALGAASSLFRDIVNTNKAHSEQDVLRGITSLKTQVQTDLQKIESAPYDSRDYGKLRDDYKARLNNFLQEKGVSQYSDFGERVADDAQSIFSAIDAMSQKSSEKKVMSSINGLKAKLQADLNKLNQGDYNSRDYDKLTKKYQDKVSKILSENGISEYTDLGDKATQTADNILSELDNLARKNTEKKVLADINSVKEEFNEDLKKLNELDYPSRDYDKLKNEYKEKINKILEDNGLSKYTEIGGKATKNASGIFAELDKLKEQNTEKKVLADINALESQLQDDVSKLNASAYNKEDYDKLTKDYKEKINNLLKENGISKYTDLGQKITDKPGSVLSQIEKIDRRNSEQEVLAGISTLETQLQADLQNLNSATYNSKNYAQLAENYQLKLNEISQDKRVSRFSDSSAAQIRSSISRINKTIAQSAIQKDNEHRLNVSKVYMVNTNETDVKTWLDSEATKTSLNTIAALEGEYNANSFAINTQKKIISNLIDTGASLEAVQNSLKESTLPLNIRNDLEEQTKKRIKQQQVKDVRKVDPLSKYIGTNISQMRSSNPIGAEFVEPLLGKSVAGMTEQTNSEYEKEYESNPLEAETKRAIRMKYISTANEIMNSNMYTYLNNTLPPTAQQNSGYVNIDNSPFNVSAMVSNSMLMFSNYDKLDVFSPIIAEKFQTLDEYTQLQIGLKLNREIEQQSTQVPATIAMLSSGSNPLQKTLDMQSYIESYKSTAKRSMYNTFSKTQSGLEHLIELSDLFDIKGNYDTKNYLNAARAVNTFKSRVFLDESLSSVVGINSDLSRMIKTYGFIDIVKDDQSIIGKLESDRDEIVTITKDNVDKALVVYTDKSYLWKQKDKPAYIIPRKLIGNAQVSDKDIHEAMTSYVDSILHLPPEYKILKRYIGFKNLNLTTLIAVDKHGNVLMTKQNKPVFINSKDIGSILNKFQKVEY